MKLLKLLIFTLIFTAFIACKDDKTTNPFVGDWYAYEQSEELSNLKNKNYKDLDVYGVSTVRSDGMLVYREEDYNGKILEKEEPIYLKVQADGRVYFDELGFDANVAKLKAMLENSSASSAEIEAFEENIQEEREELVSTDIRLEFIEGSTNEILVIIDEGADDEERAKMIRISLEEKTKIIEAYNNSL